MSHDQRLTITLEAIIRRHFDHTQREDHTMQRRDFLKDLAALGTACTLARPDRNLAAGAWAAPAKKSRPKILLRSSWQTVNIGDIAHTPGVLHLLEQHYPEAEVGLWPSSVKDGVHELLMARFPQLKIVQSRDEITAALTDYDFLLHGSGPSIVGAKEIDRWVNETQKPYGIFGVTLGTFDEATLKRVNNARFTYFRDPVSLDRARANGATCPIMDFGPDGAFAVDLANQPAADAFLTAQELTPGKFICCIPRLRYTPYWLIKNQPFDEKKHARNESMAEHDHAPLRDAITQVVRQTRAKVLLCPEDRSQMKVGKELIFDKLPEDVRPRVVWRENYWLTDEALSVYRQSLGLFGLEMHSPIMCIGNRIPALVGRFEEQTSKGMMWNAIGRQDWLFDFDQPAQLAQLSETVVSLVKDPLAAKEKAATAQKLVAAKQQAMVEQLKTTVAAST